MKPILFNTEMVRAILDGRKTVTRRIVKDIPLDAKCSCVCDDCVTFRWRSKAKNVDVVFDKEKDVNFPYYPGDVLWVRETWANHGSGYYYRADADERGGGAYYLEHRAGMTYESGVRWRPSIHMPREAARIFLRVTDVRAERLQEIDEKGAIAEGCSLCYPQGHFKSVWQHTIKPADRERYGWEANPFCWVIEFERCEKPEEARRWIDTRIPT